MSQEKIDCLINIALTSLGALTGAGSFADTAEQALRIVLLLVSITSGSMLIVINWDKWLARVKRMFKK